MGNSAPKVGNFNYELKMTEKLGTAKQDTVQFDDLDLIKGIFNFRLAEVKIWHDSNYIVGLQSVYEMDGQKKSPGSHTGNAKSTKCETLTLDKDEYIVHIIIRAGSWIDAISLTTNKGRKLAVGGNGGTAYEFNLSKGYQFISFNGGTSKYLDFLQVTFDQIY